MKLKLFFYSILFLSSISCSSPDDIAEIPLPQTKTQMFIGDDKTFYAFEGDEGNKKWSFSVESGNFTYSSPFIADKVLYVGCTNGNLYALSIDTGKLLWKFHTNGGIESSVYVSENTVYVGSTDDNFYAVNALTGELKWKFITGFNVSSSPVVSGQNVYFASDDGYIYALNKDNGDVVWDYKAGSIFNSSSVAIVQDRLYIGNRDGNLYKINKLTGELIWKKYLGSSLERSSATISEGYIYIADNYNLYKLDELTGTAVWTLRSPDHFSTSPFVNEKNVIINSASGVLMIINKENGNYRWQKTIYSNSAEAVAADNMVFVGGGGSRFIYAYTEDDAKMVWKYPASAITTSAPVVISKKGNIIYPSTSGGRD